MFTVSDESRRNPVEHDILIVRRNPRTRQYFKTEASRKKGGEGTEYKITEQTTKDSGFRTIVGLACTEATDVTDASPRGPALATLPLHPDPTASAACTCYLVNPENLTYETSWTHEEWNDQKDLPSDNKVLAVDEFQLLIATPAGRVYLVRKEHNALTPEWFAIDVRTEAELWNLLRNGAVVGSVKLSQPPFGEPRVLPLVNVESLMPSKRVDDEETLTQEADHALLQQQQG